MPFKLMLFFLFYRRFYLQTFMFVVTELLHNISHYKVQLRLYFITIFWCLQRWIMI